MMAQQQGISPFAAQYANPGGYGPEGGMYGPFGNPKSGPIGWQDGDTEPTDPFNPQDPTPVVVRGGGGGRADNTYGGTNPVGVRGPGGGRVVPDVPTPTFSDYDYIPSWLGDYYTPYGGGGQASGGATAMPGPPLNAPVS